MTVSVVSLRISTKCECLYVIEYPSNIYHGYQEVTLIDALEEICVGVNLYVDVHIQVL